MLGLLAALLGSTSPLWAQGGVGSIVGEVHAGTGDFSGRVFIELQLRHATLDSIYSDDEGKFGFYSLGSNPYHVVINDERFQPVDQLAAVNTSISAVTIVRITLVPREPVKKEPLPDRPQGSNPDLVATAEYRRRFPKAAIKEFDRGVKADNDQRHDEAIQHYQKAIALAPEFYPAHNNLGSDYVSRSDFEAAKGQFEEVIKLNQSDAAAYFNLSNVCLLMHDFEDAQKFLDEGMRREPESALGHFLLGSLKIHSGEHAAAEAALRQAMQLSPTMVQPRLQLVNLMLEEGRREDAAAQLRDFLQAFPESSFSPQARQLLKRLEAPAQASPAPLPN